MRKNKAIKFQEEFNSLSDKLEEMLRSMLYKEKNDIHIDEDTYKELYDVMGEYSRYQRVMIKVYYNDFVDKKDKIDIYEFSSLTEEEEENIEKVKEEFYYSEYRGYIESRLMRINTILDLTIELQSNNKLHKTYETRVKCRKKIKLEHSLEAVGTSIETVFKKAIIPAFSKGTKLAKSGYYAGMDELGKKADTAYENYYKVMKVKPTSTLLYYYENRDLNDNQIAIIDEILDERGAL